LKVGNEVDLGLLAAMVSAERTDLATEGMAPSLLRELVAQIRCDVLIFEGFDSNRRSPWFHQEFPEEEECNESFAQALDEAYWQHYWESGPCSYPDRSGDLRSVVMTSDFYSEREWRSTGMYGDLMRPQGLDHHPSSRCCVPISTRPISMRNVDAAPFPSSLPGIGISCASLPPGTPTPRSPASWDCPRGPFVPIWKISRQAPGLEPYGGRRPRLSRPRCVEARFAWLDRRGN
jgi:hypothetical protein